MGFGTGIIVGSGVAGVGSIVLVGFAVGSSVGRGERVGDAVGSVVGKGDG